MAEFCRTCWPDHFGKHHSGDKDFNDLKDLCKPGYMVHDLCEGCGPGWFDHNGARVVPLELSDEEVKALEEIGNALLDCNYIDSSKSTH